MVFPIVELGHPALRKKASPVTVFDKSLEKLSIDMLETMYHNSGIGLAANQIAVLKRIFVMDVDSDNPDPKVLINPVITGTGENKDESLEGCLSIRSVQFPVIRNKKIMMSYQNLNGEYYEEELEGVASICAQHELDHLNGVLFLDRVVGVPKQTIFEKLAEVGFDQKAIEMAKEYLSPSY